MLFVVYVPLEWTMYLTVLPSLLNSQVAHLVLWNFLAYCQL